MYDVSYFNDLLARMEEIFFHELSECSKPKVELVGIDFLRSKKIEGDTVEQVIESCIGHVMKEGLVKDISYSIHGFGILLKLVMKGCIHLPKEVRLEEDGVEPYSCPIANMILDRLVELLHYHGVYVAAMKVDHHKGECVVKCAIYENVEKIGQVSDWVNV